MIADIGKCYSSHFSSAKVVNAIFNAMASKPLASNCVKANKFSLSSLRYFALKYGTWFL